MRSSHHDIAPLQRTEQISEGRRDRPVGNPLEQALLAVVLGHTVMATSIICNHVLIWDNLLTILNISDRRRPGTRRENRPQWRRPSSVSELAQHAQKNASVVG